MTSEVEAVDSVIVLESLWDLSALLYIREVVVVKIHMNQTLFSPNHLTDQIRNLLIFQRLITPSYIIPTQVKHL